LSRAASSATDLLEGRHLAASALGFTTSERPRAMVVSYEICVMPRCVRKAPWSFERSLRDYQPRLKHV
jgi:hypothetical protein